jgi:hypothetical protein
MLVLPSGTALSDRVLVMLTGKPVWAPTIDVNCQEPKTLRKIPG